jgi:hypothetical protein
MNAAACTGLGLAANLDDNTLVIVATNFLADERLTFPSTDHVSKNPGGQFIIAALVVI